jgi:integrase
MIKSVVMKDTGPRWYVEYRELNPISGTFERRRDYGYVNKVKDLDERRRRLHQLYQEIVVGIGKRYAEKQTAKAPIQQRITLYLDQIRGVVRKRTYSDIKGTLEKWHRYMQMTGASGQELHEVTKEQMFAFRAYRAKQVANTTANKEFATVKTFFNYYKNNFTGVLAVTPGQGASKLKGSPETHVAFTSQQVEGIYSYLQQHDPQLLLYCKVIGMGFLRCQEARALRVGDIDFRQQKMVLTAAYSKTRERMVKPMLSVFTQALIDAGIDKLEPHQYVFSYGVSGSKLVHEGYFRRRFKAVKEHFHLTRLHTIYGFRHTSVSEMIANGAPWREIMKYTGHKSMASFEKYARSLGVKPAEDLSRYLNV